MRAVENNKAVGKISVASHCAMRGAQSVLYPWCLHSNRKRPNLACVAMATCLLLVLSEANAIFRRVTRVEDERGQVEAKSNYYSV